MAKQIKELSVFLPAYNEEASIEEVVLKTKSVLTKTAENWELIVINDGSKDDTQKVVERLAKEDKRIRVVSHETNRGYGASLKTGLYGAKYEWIAFIDSDGQFDFSEIDQFLEKQKATNADLVIGYYKKRQVSKFKIITSKVWELSIFTLFDLKVKDIDCGFKLMRKSVVDKIPKLESERGAFISSELLIKAKKAGFKIVEIPVTHYPRTTGEGTGRKIDVIVKSFVDLAKLWLKTQTPEFWILLSILIVAAFCRLYKIDQYMTFLGDEGRDVIIVRRIFTELHPPLIGPGTSIGNMYLGPFYYYMMAPALLIAGFSPVGPAVQIAILGIITVWMVWYVGKKWFPTTSSGPSVVGLVAAGLYSISPTVIIYSRSSWNPNIMPFFALLSIYSIWKVWKEHKFNWLVMMGFSFAAALQSHYLALLLVPTLFIFWILTFINLKFIRNSKFEIRDFLKKSVLGFVIFSVMMSPLFFFDLRHNWTNARAMYAFFTVRQQTVSIRPWTAIPKLPEILNQVNTTVIGAKNILAGDIASVAMVGMVIWSGWLMWRKKATIQPFSNLAILISWLGFGLIGFGIYKQNIYDHYFGFLFAVPFFLIGIFVSVLFKNKYLKILGIILVGYLVVINLMQNPLLKQPNRLLGRSIDVSKVIEKESNGKPFNLAVIADTNYEDGYKYFLLKDNYPVVDIDAQRPETVTSQLFVVCELIPNSKCDPTHSPKAQVTSFGWTKVEMHWEVDGAIIYKLTHSKP